MVNWKKDLDRKMKKLSAELKTLEEIKKKGGGNCFKKPGYVTVRVTPTVIRRRAI